MADRVHTNKSTKISHLWPAYVIYK